MSDRIIKAAERIQGLYHQGIYQEETDKIAAILREAFPAPSVQGKVLPAIGNGATPIGRTPLWVNFEDESWVWDDLAKLLTDRYKEPDLSELIRLLQERNPELLPAPSAQGEDERALDDLDSMKRRLMDESDAMDEVTTHRWWWRYSQNVDSRLRSRLAEPASSTATAKAEVIASHGYLANPDDVGRVAHLLEQMEPAQAASSEDSPAISSVTLRASIAVEHETERRIAAEERAARAEAALASERVKREGEPCAHCGPPAWEGYRPAPDVAVLREAAQGLLDLMDEVPIDPSLGEETDRVFSRAEFGALRKALGGEA